MGGGGGGGHAFNFSRGTQFGGAGGFGGGIIIMKGSNLKSNGMAIKANGSDGENADQDGAGGGGAGGAFLLDFQSFTGSLRARVNGGKGGDAIPLACDDPGDNSYSIRYRYSAAGGGGGGGVVWLSQPNEDVFDLTFQSNFAQAPAGSNSDLFNSLAAPGGPSRSQSDLFFIENIPIGNSVLTVGGTSPEPDFPNLAKAAEFLSLAATDAPEITLLLAPNLSNATTLAWYKDPVVFKPIFTPACQVSEAKLLIKPRTGINTVNIQNEVDDITFIKAEGLPQITFKDLTISATEQDISTSIVSENGSRLIFDNVTVKADVTSLSNGSNEITLINSTHEGSIVVGQNQRLKLEGSLVRMNGDSIQGRSVTLGPGSAFYLGDGKTLDLNGVSWINNGADTVEISSSANLRLSGNFKNQQIGGIVPSSFNRVDITSSGKITLNSTVNAFHWNQTGAATVINENNQFLNVKNIITTGTGSFTSIGFGRVRLQADGSSPVEISGRFGNLELISPSGALATGQVDIDQNLILSDGIFYSDSLNPRLNIANTDPFSIVSLSPESWVNGILNRKVAAGGLYSFPVGDRFRPQTLSLNLNSLSGGLSAVNVKFVPSDPHSHPQESVVLTHEDDNIIFREVLPGGYWSVNPDSGSANYNVWLYPKFYGNFPQYSVMKRSGGGNEWKVYGNLENPDSTYSFIQNDSSVRRSGLIGFSDFAVAGGEDPLPLHFLDFRVSNKLGTPQLNWIMAECAEGTRFHVWRGLSKSSLQKTSQYLDAGNRNCLKQFEFADEAAGKPLRNLYYRIEANAPGELSAFSEIRSFSPVAGEKQKASIAAIPGMPGQFLLLGDGVNPESVALYATDGRLLKFNPGNGSSLLDLQQYPAGMYVVEFEQDGVKSRQRIVVSH